MVLPERTIDECGAPKSAAPDFGRMLELVEELAALAEPFVWHPAATAPCNRIVLAWSGGCRFMTRDADTGQWRNILGRPKVAPSHWMPLPEGPQVSQPIREDQ